MGLEEGDEHGIYVNDIKMAIMGHVKEDYNVSIKFWFFFVLFLNIIFVQ